MKTKPVCPLLILLSSFTWRAVALCVGVSCYLAPSVFPQGSLTPPGAPAPTMKSLDQIEPRTPISSLPFTISTGGGYYLTKNLNIASGDAITITVSGVTLDLNGFEITSTESSPAHSGVVLNGGVRNIRIMNGAIRGNVTLSGSSFSGSGFANGIQANAGATANTHVSDVAVSGCLANGINLGNSGLVESCTSSVTGSIGIRADTVIYSNAYQFGIEGINANNNATGCYANSSASTTADGISAGYAVIGCLAFSNAASGAGAIVTTGVARDCYAVADGGAGDALLASTAENCWGFALGTGSGIHCSYSASNCYGATFANSAAAVNVAGSALNCYGAASGNGIGLSASSAQNCYGAGGSGIGLSALSAQNCYGSSSGANVAGLDVGAGTALNCYGTNSGTASTCVGLSAEDATGCFGSSTNGTGLSADSASGCTGITSTGTGLSAGEANTCQGTVTSSSADNTSLGLYCGGDALNSHGQAFGSAAGLFSVNATGCSAYTDKGTALGVPLTFGVAIGCVGKSQGGGIGLEGFIANSCTIPFGTQSITHKYNMP